MKHLVLLLTLLAVPASSAIAQTSTPDAVIQELVQLEREKDQAYEKGSKSLLDQIYADDYQATTANGTIITKQTVLDFFVRPNIFEVHRSEDIAVRVFGDVALVTGVQKRKFYKDVKPGGEDTLRYTNIYAKRQGKWQIVASHYSTVKK
jgi:ketosteroid isomerase-like protein